ncbi:class I SAM-dependent methyltransferase [Paenibacillus spiritus]|uniref:Class I SAM-dependent methyltransferase n=1 Tax=Paenibacillus spiritus TaxID=2496557 RepID=A0A5J5GGV7_9BACL|nr:class I SAM-dependent methyltransferase [Paenibacillus spiritus]KAA9007327.1 class I SAM-dependent methyltransferase [Paenibacillus spiritus]
MFTPMAEFLEEREMGKFKLSKFTITKENRSWRDYIPDGTYTRLTRSGEVVMSDTPMEQRTNSEFVRKAHGDVFIAGLGIGMILIPILKDEKIKTITILEKHEEVIELVGKQLELNDKVRIIHGDVFTYEHPKGTKFDTIYFDIWDWVNSDVWNNEMKPLKRKYLKYRRSLKENPDAFIKCWAEYHAKNNLRLL